VSAPPRAWDNLTDTRLSLRYGVARVYAQQCGYVLTDAETARNNLRAVFKVMRASALDAQGGNKAR